MALGNILDKVPGPPNTVNLQREYNWEIVLPDIWGIIVSGIVPSKFCQAVKFGQYNVSEIAERKEGTWSSFIPGKFTVEPITMRFLTPVPDVVTFYFQMWKKQMVTNKGLWQLPARFKKNMYLIFYDTTGVPSNMISFKGVFPITFPSFDLGYDKDGALMYDVTFRVDRIEMAAKAAMGLVGDLVQGFGSLVTNPQGVLSGIVGDVTAGIFS
jgi:hypothetical protein